MRFLRCDSQAAADALSRELWSYSRPVRDKADVTTHALLVTQDGGDWGLSMPDGFELRRHASHEAGRAATIEMEKIATRGATSTLVARPRITMDQLATMAGARVRTA